MSRTLLWQSLPSAGCAGEGVAPNCAKPVFAPFSLGSSDPTSAGATDGQAPTLDIAQLCLIVLTQLWGPVPTTAAARSQFGFDGREAAMSSGILGL